MGIVIYSTDDHLTESLLVEGYPTDGRGLFFLMRRVSWVGGREKTKHKVSLISDHANRTDLAGTFEGTFLPAIPRGALVSSMPPCVSPVFLMRDRHHIGPLHMRSFKSITTSRRESQTSSSSKTVHGFPHPNRETLHNSNQTSTLR